MVGGDGARGTGALLLGIAIVATRAGVHGADEHKIGWEGERAIRTADRYTLVFNGLAQHFEDALAKLGELVQKEYSAMRQ